MPVMPVMSVPPLQNTGKTEASNRQRQRQGTGKGGISKTHVPKSAYRVVSDRSFFPS